MTEAQNAFLRWLWARGPTRQLRSSSDWTTAQRMRDAGFAACIVGYWWITEAGKEAIRELV